MMKLNLILKHVHVLIRSFLNHIAPKMSWLNILKNVTICLVSNIVIINIWMVNCPIFWICYFRLGKKWCLQNLHSKKEWSSTIIFSQLWQCQIIWYLFESFKTIILCSVCSMQFVKYVLPVKIWLVKTLTRIVKYESRVVKSNPGQKQMLYFILVKHWQCIKCIGNNW